MNSDGRGEKRFIDFADIVSPDPITLGYDEAKYKSVRHRDRLQIGEKLFRNALIEEISVLGLKVKHESGIAFLYFPDLPEENRSTFCFSEEVYVRAVEGLRRPDASSLSHQAQQSDPTLRHEQRLAPVRQRAVEAVEAGKPKRTSCKTIGGNISVDLTSRTYTTNRFVSRTPATPNIRTSNAGFPSQRCAGMTKKGFRCKRMVASGSYCHDHQW